MSEIQMIKVSGILKNVVWSFDFDTVDWWEILANKVSHNHFDWLCDEIARDGFLVPIVIVLNNDGTLTLGNGHHRLCAAILLGLDKIPVILSRDDAMCWEESHNGDVELSAPSFDYWEMLCGNMPGYYPGDCSANNYREQYDLYDEDYYEDYPDDEAA